MWLLNEELGLLRGQNTTMADPATSEAKNENLHKQLRSLVNDMTLI